MTDLSILASPAAALSVIIYFLIRDAIAKKKNHNPSNPGNSGMTQLQRDHATILEKLKTLHEDNEDVKGILREILSK